VSKRHEAVWAGVIGEDEHEIEIGVVTLTRYVNRVTRKREGCLNRWSVRFLKYTDGSVTKSPSVHFWFAEWGVRPARASARRERRSAKRDAIVKAACEAAAGLNAWRSAGMKPRLLIEESAP